MEARGDVAVDDSGWPGGRRRGSCRNRAATEAGAAVEERVYAGTARGRLFADDVGNREEGRVGERDGARRIEADRCGFGRMADDSVEPEEFIGDRALDETKRWPKGM